MEGVYRGIYKVNSSDTLVNQALIFRLEDRNGQVVTKKSRGKISFKAADFPLVGVTKGERVYLDFGLGDDRLGGAKLAFIQEGIRLIVTGKIGNRYRVRLTESHEAWIPEDQVELQPTGTHLPLTLTGNWSVTGRDKYDEVSISLGEKLPYSSFTESDPTRIHIDVYGAVSNSNWITQQLSTKEIKNAYYSQVSKQQFRITLELNHRQTCGGKSVVFLYMVLLGYAAGLTHKLLYSRDWVIALYAINGVMVMIDIVLYYRNRKISLRQD